jgi:hypothetical protein
MGISPKIIQRSPFDYNSDQNLIELITHGPGAIFLQKINDQTYEIDLNKDIWDLPVRPRFDNYGACLRLVRTSDGFKVDSITWTKPDGLLISVFRSVPGDSNWNYAKLRFRSTFIFWITLGIHLVHIHLLTAGSCFTTVIRTLPSDHSLRKILAPFHFRSGRINREAVELLTPIGGVLQRVTSLTNQGLEKAIQIAYCRYGFDFKAYSLTPIDGVPFIDDGITLYTNIHNGIMELLEKLYPSDQDLVNDIHLTTWLDCLLELNSKKSWTQKYRSISEVGEIISHLIFTVTACHEWFGSIIKYVANPNYCPPSLKSDGTIPGRTQTEMTWWLALFVTAPMPNIKSDFSHLAGDDIIVKEFFTLTWPNLLDQTEAIIKERNQSRTTPCHESSPSNLSCSVSI